MKSTWLEALDFYHRTKQHAPAYSIWARATFQYGKQCRATTR